MPRYVSKQVLFFLFLFVSLGVRSQVSNQSLIMHTLSGETHTHTSHASFMWVADNAILRYNPVSLGFGLMLYTYQNVVSKQISASCLYSPSCSHYSRTLIEDLGLVKGVLLSSDRIMRCNRIAALDISPSEVDSHDHKVHENTGMYRHHE